ncbi:MAG: pyrroline-5-carboxylate reductase [Chthoniobacteraceae bacterium]
MKLGFLGSGKMASALARGVVHSGDFEGSQLIVSDVVKTAAGKLARATGAKVAANNRELATSCDVLVLCVKPADALAALREASVPLAGKLVISIVAGLPLLALEEAAVATARLIRVMPNTPALIGQGAAAYTLGRSATAADAALTERIFSAVGFAVRVKEELLDVVTGLSGSGPAFIYTVIEALADGGVLMGLPRDLALRLAAQTVAGAAGMVRETDSHPAVLRDQVTSPGGTTVAGLEVLETFGLRAALISAVRAATERSRELGRITADAAED